MFTIAFDTPYMGRMTEIHDSMDSARAAIMVALRRFTNVTVNGIPVALPESE